MLIRFLLYAWSKHPQTPEEAKSVAAMSINQTANTTEGEKDSKKSKYTYEHPTYAGISIVALLFIPIGALLTAVLLGVFRISITALAYMVLLTIVIVCCFSILWIVMEDDDDDRESPSQTPAINKIISTDDDDDESKSDTTANREGTRHNNFKRTVIRGFEPETLSPITDALFRSNT